MFGIGCVHYRQFFNRIGEAYVKQLAELKKLRSGMGAKTSKKSGGGTEVTIPGGDHRSFVTDPQSDNLPMVPGPKEKQ